MKAFTYVLIVLFIFSIGIGNERLLKVTEALFCKSTLPFIVCTLSPPCEALCKRIFGSAAIGDCIYNKCTCLSPCGNL
ncbi:hypothetical protein HN51_067151 [Arachis hypogaea]|nr:uncharacterized protein DS421_14g473880 [Arachis hypogaea]